MRHATNEVVGAGVGNILGALVRAGIFACAGWWMAFPTFAMADNCSSLGDCYFTVASGIGVASAIGVGALVIVFWSDIVHALGGFADGIDAPGDLIGGAAADGTIRLPGDAGATHPATGSVDIDGAAHAPDAADQSPGEPGMHTPPAQGLPPDERAPLASGDSPGHVPDQSVEPMTGATPSQPGGDGDVTQVMSPRASDQPDIDPASPAASSPVGGSEAHTPAHDVGARPITSHPTGDGDATLVMAPRAGDQPAVDLHASPTASPIGGHMPHTSAHDAGTAATHGTTAAGDLAAPGDARGSPMQPLQPSAEAHGASGYESPVPETSPTDAPSTNAEGTVEASDAPTLDDEGIPIAPEGKMILEGQVADAEPGIAPEGMALSAGRLVPGDVTAVASKEPLIAPEGMANESGQLVAANAPGELPVAGEGQALVAGTPVDAGSDLAAGLVSDEARKQAGNLPAKNA